MAAEDALGRQFDKVRGITTEPFIYLAETHAAGGVSPKAHLAPWHKTEGVRRLQPGDERFARNETGGMPWIGYN